MNTKLLSTQLMALAAMDMMFTSPTKTTKLENIDMSTKTPPIPKGHKKFIIGGETIWALNRKNAMKKFDKLPK